VHVHVLNLSVSLFVFIASHCRLLTVTYMMVYALESSLTLTIDYPSFLRMRHLPIMYCSSSSCKSMISSGDLHLVFEICKGQLLRQLDLLFDETRRRQRILALCMCS